MARKCASRLVASPVPPRAPAFPGRGCPAAWARIAGRQEGSTNQGHLLHLACSSSAASSRTGHRQDGECASNTCSSARPACGRSPRASGSALLKSPRPIGKSWIRTGQSRRKLKSSLFSYRSVRFISDDCLAVAPWRAEASVFMRSLCADWHPVSHLYADRPYSGFSSNYVGIPQPCWTSSSPYSALAASCSWRPTPPCATGSSAMFDLILGGAVSACLLVYLVWALVRPEDF